MFKKLLCLLIIIVILIPALSCYGTVSPTGQSSSPSVSPDSSLSLTTTSSTSVSTPVDTQRPTSPFQLKISRIPKPEETAELDFYPAVQPEDIAGKNKPIASLANGRAWVDFYWTNIDGSYYEASHGELVPLNEVLVAGQATVSGNVRDTYVLKSTIKFPKEGIWKIQGNVQGEGWDTPESLSGQIIVSDKYTGYFDQHSTALASSPLGYLQYFNYGYFGTRNREPNKETDPIILETNISKAPKPGEEATFTVKITSLHGVANFSSEMTFAKNRGYEEVFPNNLFVDGDLKWSGDLKAGKPVQYSADIKFPEEGEWSIGAIGNSKERKDQHILGFGDSIQLTINNNKSYYGWKPEPVPGNTSSSPNQATVIFQRRDSRVKEIIMHDYSDFSLYASCHGLWLWI